MDAYKNNFFLNNLSFFMTDGNWREVAEPSPRGLLFGAPEEMFEKWPLMFFTSAHFPIDNYNPTKTLRKNTFCIIVPGYCSRISATVRAINNLSYIYILKKSILSGRKFRICHISTNKLLSLRCCRLLWGRHTWITNTTCWLLLISVYRYTPSSHKLTSLLCVTSLKLWNLSAVIIELFRVVQINCSDFIDSPENTVIFTIVIFFKKNKTYWYINVIIVQMRCCLLNLLCF